MMRPLWTKDPERPAKRARKGGWRMQLEDIPDEAEVVFSKFGAGLMQKWADGLMSAVDVQFHAANAKDDGLSTPFIDKLAAVPPGKHAQGGLVSLLSSLGLRCRQTKIEPGSPDGVNNLLLPSTVIKLLHTYHKKSLPSPLGGRLNETS